MCNEKARKNTPAEMIEVIKAHEAGKKIEYTDVGMSAAWRPADPEFNFGLCQYRVKEEPKFLFVIYNKYGGPYRYLRDTTQREAEMWLAYDNHRDGDTLTMKRYVEG